jgi:hypothetical protein
MTVFVNPELTNAQQTLHSLAEKVRILAAVAQTVQERLTDAEGIMLDHEDCIRDHHDRIEALENPQPKAKPRDDTNERILTYLREVGCWQTPGTIAANLELNGSSVADRLFRMARNGNCGLEVRGGKGTGQHPLYRIVPSSTPEV